VIAEFNLDSKAECGQLNQAHVTRNKKNVKKKKLKQIRQYHLVRSKAKNCEDCLEGTRKTMEERICETEKF